MTYYRVYYSDGSFYDSNSTEPLPVIDTQIIVQRDKDRGWITTHGADFYVWKDERWWPVEQYGLYRFLMDTGLVLFGETVPHREFDVIYQKAKAHKLEMAGIN